MGFNCRIISIYMASICMLIIYIHHLLQLDYFVIRIHHGDFIFIFNFTSTKRTQDRGVKSSCHTVHCVSGYKERIHSLITNLI